MKSLRDEIRLRRVVTEDFIQPEIYLGFHLNAVKISSKLCLDFITVGDFIFHAVLFTFYMLYGIIILGGYLLDKLEFDEEVIYMKKKLHIIGSILLIVSVLISCTGCFGYATRLPNNTYDKVSKILFGVDGTEYALAYKDSMDDFVVAIEKTLDSGKIDIANGFGVFGKVKMPYGDSAVENQKKSTMLWFEMLIENGKYKKLFFTLQANDTQTIWIQATETDSYDDGGFLEYYACDCKELIELATKYAKSITGIDGATKIEATKYDMGIEIDSVTVTEATSIKHIVDNLNSLKLKELKYNEPTAIEYE